MKRSRLLAPEVLDAIAGMRFPLDADSLDVPVSQPSGESLFRPDALRNQAYGRFGRPVAKLPFSWTLLTCLLVFALGFAAAFMALQTYARDVTVRGLVSPANSDVQVSPPTRGIIEKVMVSEGATVHQGDLLFTVSTYPSSADGKNPIAKSLSSLNDQERSIRSRIEAIKAGGELEDRTALAQVAAMDASLASARADLRFEQEQAQMAEDDYGRAVPIAKRGFVSGEDLRRRKQSAVAAEQAVADTEGRIKGLLAQLSQLRFLAAERPLQTSQDIGKLEDMLTDIEERRQQYLLSTGFSVKAPIAGTVTTLQINRGEIVDPSRPVLAIIPANSPMIAVLYVPSSGVGLLQRGQRVHLRYDAFPFDTVGSAQGTIASISHTPVKPTDVDQPISIQGASYIVKVKLDRQYVGAYGERHALLSGMALTADIILERRSFLRWLLDPLFAGTDLK